MNPRKKEHPKVKTRLHPRSKHRERYNFKELIGSLPELAQFVHLNDYDDETINFSDPDAVKSLNKALLKFYYKIEHWNVPSGYLSPPIPGRADYIHHIAEFLGSKNNGRIPTGKNINCLDIGVGANCIYPLIGHKEYGWSFVGSEIDPEAINAASKIVELNGLSDNIEFRKQIDPKEIFNGIIKKGEYFDIAICNPPFNASLKEAQEGSRRKSKNLGHKKAKAPVLNFGGMGRELWCEGGEKQFIHTMIEQSRIFATSCNWFSTLVSKRSNLKSTYIALNNVNAVDRKTIPMGQGNKSSRIVIWTFLTPKQQAVWVNTRWNK